jgi:uncharacterized protein (DUF58 family)
MSRGRTYTLRNAASIVFALTAVIPLLLFTYTLYALNQLKLTEAQMGLGVALACALVGLFIFSNLMARLSEVLRLQEPPDHALGRSQGGFSTKVHLVCEGQGTVLAVWVTPGQRHEAQAFAPVMLRAQRPRWLGRPRWPRRVAGDKGYSYRHSPVAAPASHRGRHPHP